ncbi:hypothetical protein Tco_0243114 [Tanacetum coccineum]
MVSHFAIPATKTTPAQPSRTVLETYSTVGDDIKNSIDAKVEAVHIMLTGIDNDIYSTVDACPNAKEMWKAIEKLMQGKDLKTISYHKRFDIMKQHRNEMNEIRAERLPRNANPLALITCYYRSKSKEISKSPSPASESEHEVIGQYKNQRAVAVSGKRETVGNQVVQQTGIQCFKCKGFVHTTKECRSAKRVKDSTYHKEKMLLCKQEEDGEVIPATNKDTRPIDDTKLLEKLHSDDVYNVFSNERLNPMQPESINDTYVVEKIDSNITYDSSNMNNNEEEVDQDDEKYQDECVLLALLIENMKLEIDERKKIKENVLCLLY